MLFADAPEVADEPKRLPLVEDDDDDDEEEDVVAEEAPVVAARQPQIWRSVVVRMGDEVLLSFEARSEDDTFAVMDRATYLTMAMYAFGNGLSAAEALPMIKDWIEVEVRGG